MKELSLNDTKLLTDLESKGMLIPKSRWSQYKSNKKGQITDEQLVFVAERLDIRINVHFGTPTVEDGKIKFKILPYNEKSAISRLKLLYPTLVR